MSDCWRYAAALLLWPGLAGGALLGWLYLWLRRKLIARLQGRFGPPFYQPAFDFLKLLGKKTVVPGGVTGGCSTRCRCSRWRPVSAPWP